MTARLFGYVKCVANCRTVTINASINPLETLCRKGQLSFAFGFYFCREMISTRETARRVDKNCLIPDKPLGKQNLRSALLVEHFDLTITAHIDAQLSLCPWL
jgi:hypothetical protein